MGLKSGSDMFFITSSVQALCMILLHTFWSVIFFDAFDRRRYAHITFVVLSHLFVSVLTLLNVQELYAVTLLTSMALTVLTGLVALKVAGGSAITIKRFITCQ